MNDLWEGNKTERILFSAAILFQAIFFLCILWQYRIPIGHDSFQYFTLQYYFLNNTVFTHETPLWMPFMTQGTVASWWYGLQAGLLSNALGLFGPLLKGINFVYIFLLGFWVDELVLLVGCWLWAKIFFRSAISVFFFTMTMVMTAVWWTQPWYNFHLYYFLPLMFYFIHRLINTGQTRYGIILAGLLVLQLLGNLPYFLPMTTFILSLYLVIWLVFSPSGLKQILSPRLKWIYVILLGAILCAVYYYTVTYGTDQIVNYNNGRAKDHTTNLNGFLHFGGGFAPQKWGEMILGVSPSFDYSLYGGVFMIPLLLSGFLYWFDKRIFPLLVVIVLMLDLNMGGVLANIIFYAWPLMKYYRHIGLLGPILKMFICFLAAFVLDQLIRDAEMAQRQRWAICAFLLWIAAFYALFSGPSILNQMVPERWPEFVAFKQMITPTLMLRRETVAAIALIGSAIAFILARPRSKKVFNLALGAMIALHLFDIIAYKIHETVLRSIPIKSYRSQLFFERMPFERYRQPLAIKSDRLKLIRSLPIRDSVQYWSNDSFAFIDEVGSSWRVEHWLKPMDQFMRVYWKQPMDNALIKPKGLIPQHALNFPSDHPAARKFSSLEAPKIQLFTDALFVSDKRTMAQLMVDKNYLGDIPLIEARANTQDIEKELSKNSRINLSYTLVVFSADCLKIKFTAPRAGWLMYSDIWHSAWRATVNNLPVDVQKANLAYKIIRVKQGGNVVIFQFGSWPIRFCRWILSLFSLMGIMGLFWLIEKIYANSEWV